MALQALAHVSACNSRRVENIRQYSLPLSARSRLLMKPRFAAIQRGETEMTSTKTIRLIRLVQARELTRGGAVDGELEIDFTRVKPLG